MYKQTSWTWDFMDKQTSWTNRLHRLTDIQQLWVAMTDYRSYFPEARNMSGIEICRVACSTGRILDARADRQTLWTNRRKTCIELLLQTTLATSSRLGICRAACSTGRLSDTRADMLKSENLFKNSIRYFYMWFCRIHFGTNFLFLVEVWNVMIFIRKKHKMRPCIY